MMDKSKGATKEDVSNALVHVAQIMSLQESSEQSQTQSQNLSQAQLNTPSKNSTSQDERSTYKCDHRSCKFTSIVIKHKCFVANCNRFLHWDCYERHVLRRNLIEHFQPNFQPDFINTPEYRALACCKKHYDRAIKRDFPETCKEIRDECRRMLYVKCLHLLHKQGKVSRHEEEKFCFDSYHGNAEKEIKSVATSFCVGDGDFSGAWEVPDPSKPDQLCLSKLLYVYEEASNMVEQKKNFCPKFLQKTSISSYKIDIRGRSIREIGMKSFAVLKKVMPLIPEFFDNNGLHKMGPGKSEQDAFHALLDKCYELGIGDDNEDTSDEEESTTDDKENTANGTDSDGADGHNNDRKRPTYWYFPGYMALVLFGPFARNMEAGRVIDFSSDIIPPKEKKKENSKSSIRVAKKIVQTIDHDCSRSLSNSDRIHLCALELEQSRFEHKLRESQLVNLRMEANLLIKNIELEERRIKSSNPTECLPDYSQTNEMYTDLREMRLRMKEIRKETQVAISAGTKRTRETIRLLGGDEGMSPKLRGKKMLHSLLS